MELKHEIKSNFKINENTEFSEVVNYKDGKLMSVLDSLTFNLDNSRIGISVSRDENGNLKIAILNVVKDVKTGNEVAERQVTSFIIDPQGRKVTYTEASFNKPKGVSPHKSVEEKLKNVDEIIKKSINERENYVKTLFNEAKINTKVFNIDTGSEENTRTDEKEA
ncbi:hypothetical protein [Sulfuracidifex tepidarius]|uniref:Uncharacterized protein n=1 Tax=Sulfuracidifex tepidarius TaxID=1294262 RepID=A0A510DXY5_9CREN|nr:hypothetical protein [Sulfuracidifex tepidarius]BBG25049.1 hypothetical protein IC006_2384 [Sulfuracidifex tepidarius]BBG27831.1 hypothetical protein IC007_2386 [Sulfuracidifex tepidarius]